MTRYISVILSAFAILASAPALAIRGEPINLSTIRHQNATPPSSRTIRVEGSLKCSFSREPASGSDSTGAAPSNDGQGCALTITDAKTGHTFNLIEAQTAMRLYLDASGSKQTASAPSVAIEGSLADPDTIQVNSAKSIF
jgi:hypothetical protein